MLIEEEHHLDEVCDLLGHLISTWSKIELPFLLHKAANIEGYVEITSLSLFK